MKIIPLILMFLGPQLLLAKSLFDKKHGDACGKYVNLQRKNWITQRNVPTLDQGPVGLCYSHAAVNLVDFYRDIHLPRTTKNIAPSNPIYAALLFKIFGNETEKKSLDSGFGTTTINAIKKYGMCRFDIIDAAMEKFSNSGRVSTRDWYAITEWFLEFYNTQIEKEIEVASNKEAKLKEIFGRYESRKKVKDIYEHGDFSKIFAALKPYLKDKNYHKFAQEVFAPCFLPENIYLPTKSLPPILSKSPSPKIIMEQLEQRNPVGIAYNAGVLHKDTRNINKAIMFFSPGNHESVIIGKRVRENKCQFLLKNTWGNYCKYSWECQKSPQGEEVGAWINADLLMAATRKIYYFQLKK